MPVIKAPTTATKRYYLPSTKDNPDESERAWIDVKERLTLRDFDVVSSLYAGPVEQALYTMAVVIKDWNFTTQDGKKAEINPNTIHDAFNENVDDWEYVNNICKKLIEAYEGAGNDKVDPEQKKTSTDTSTQPIQVRVPPAQ